MKAIIISHKTPKFGDIYQEPPLSKPSSNPSLIKKRNFSYVDNSHKPPKAEKPIENSRNTEIQKPNYKENKSNIPKPSKNTEFLEKKMEKILTLNEKPQKSRSKSSLEVKESRVLEEKTKQALDFLDDSPKLKENSEEILPKANIKEKIDFINQIFDSINNKRIKTEHILQESPKKESEEEEEELNPRRSRIFPEPIMQSKEIDKKNIRNFNRKSSKEDFESSYEEKAEKNDEFSDKKEEFIYKKEETPYRKEITPYKKKETHKENYVKMVQPSQSPLKKTIMKNFVQANKKNNGLGRKMYENYEKILKCFDNEVIYQKETNKANMISRSPIIKPIKSPIKTKNMKEKLSPMKKIPIKYIENSKKTPTRSTLSRDSRRISNLEKKENENKENKDMKSLYIEISNLTRTLNKTAVLMNETFKKIETLNKTPQKMRRESPDSESDV